MDPNFDEIVNICVNPRGMCEPLEIEQNEESPECFFEESLKGSFQKAGNS